MQRFYRCIPVGFLALAVLISSAASAVTAQIAPSRTTGVAPLAVYFDAVSSSASGADPIHDLHYERDFGDSGSGTWAQSGASKNSATGPWAAHVYDNGPAVDAGGAISWLGSDFAGGTRPTDGDGNGSVQWDLGAFELGGGGGTVPPPPAAPAAPVLLP